MNKTTTIRARIEPELKEHVEKIFHRLGLNTTQALSLFYRQVELRNGLPFELLFLTKKPGRRLQTPTLAGI